MNNITTIIMDFTEQKDFFVEMPDKTILPMTAYGSITNESNVKLVLGHGLGVKNPKLTHHKADPWLNLALSAVGRLDITCVLYTARGHGESIGWQDSAESNPSQFIWSKMCFDMKIIMDYIGPPAERTIIGGSSMGAATALYTAMNTDKICGLILIRPPTAWETRLARRGVLIKQAQKLLDANPDARYHYVIQASAMSDLPNPTDDMEMYKRIKCPVLIFAIDGDDAHPVSTATVLASAIGDNVQLFVAETNDQAKHVFPNLIVDFINRCREISMMTSRT